MRKGALVAAALFLVFGIASVPAAGLGWPTAKGTSGVAIRLEAYQPDGTPLKCDGTDALSGIGLIRFRAFATATSSTSSEELRIVLDKKPDESQGDSWYVDATPTLPAGQTVEVFDNIQDLDPAGVDWSMKFADKGSNGSSVDCRFSAANVPSPNEGLISHRNPQPDMVEKVRIALEKYSDKSPIACGSKVKAGRVRAKVYVTNGTTEVLDFHLHHELPASRTVGPDQDGNAADERFWEVGVDSLNVSGGSEKQLSPITVASTPVGRNTFHFMQQHGPDQLKMEAFCSFTNG